MVAVSWELVTAWEAEKNGAHSLQVYQEEPGVGVVD